MIKIGDQVTVKRTDMGGEVIEYDSWELNPYIHLIKQNDGKEYFYRTSELEKDEDNV